MVHKLSAWLSNNGFDKVASNSFKSETSDGFSELWLNSYEKIYFWFKSINQPDISVGSFFYCFKSKLEYIAHSVDINFCSFSRTRVDDCISKLVGKYNLLKQTIHLGRELVYLPYNCSALYILASDLPNPMVSYLIRVPTKDTDIKRYLKLLDFCKLLFDANISGSFIPNRDESTKITVEALYKYCKNIDKDVLSLYVNKLKGLYNVIDCTWCEGLSLEEWEEKHEDLVQYLHGYCHEWVRRNYKNGDKCIAITEYRKDIGKICLMHSCLLRDGKYVDVRGATDNLNDILEAFDWGEYEVETYSTLNAFNVRMSQLGIKF